MTTILSSLGSVIYKSGVFPAICCSSRSIGNTAGSHFIQHNYLGTKLLSLLTAAPFEASVFITRIVVSARSGRELTEICSALVAVATSSSSSSSVSPRFPFLESLSLICAFRLESTQSAAPSRNVAVANAFSVAMKRLHTLTLQCSAASGYLPLDDSLVTAFADAVASSSFPCLTDLRLDRATERHLRQLFLPGEVRTAPIILRQQLRSLEVRLDQQWDGCVSMRTAFQSLLLLKASLVNPRSEHLLESQEEVRHDVIDCNNDNDAPSFLKNLVVHEMPLEYSFDARMGMSDSVRIFHTELDLGKWIGPMRQIGNGWTLVASVAHFQFGGVITLRKLTLHSEHIIKIGNNFLDQTNHQHLRELDISLPMCREIGFSFFASNVSVVSIKLNLPHVELLGAGFLAGPFQAMQQQAAGGGGQSSTIDLRSLVHVSSVGAGFMRDVNKGTARDGGSIVVLLSDALRMSENVPPRFK